MDNHYDRDFINEMTAISMIQKLIRTKHFKPGIVTILDGHEFKKLSRDLLESHPMIKSNITDKEMLLTRIDWALENGDKDLFINLTDKLKETEIVERGIQWK